MSNNNNYNIQLKKEKKIAGSPDPVSISGTRKILEQLINCVCKIKVKGASGTGFFCKVPLGNNQTIKCLMTNHHVIDEQYYNQNKEINLLINDDKDIKSIDTNSKRITFFSENYDIAIIQLKETDKIQNFLDLDENLFIDKENVYYEDISVYILQYPKGKNAMVSYGILNQFNNYNINHTGSTDDGSSGSPILNLESNKVIGIHKEGSVPFNFNKGIFLKLPLIEFIKQIKNSNNKINESINNNMMIGSNISINNNNQFSMINNINNNIDNNIIGINNLNIGNNNMNLFNSQNSGNQIYDNLSNSGPKMNVIFTTGTGSSKVLILDYGTTVDDMLKIYLKKENKLDLYGSYNKIGFLYNIKNIQFGNTTPIELFFKNRRTPKVQVSYY